MKRTATLLLAILLMTSIFAQPPEKISYQAVIRDSDNNLLTDQVIGMQISILKGSAGGSSVYVETHTPTSNANGLVSIEIGSGTVVSGDFTTIDWAGGPYFIKIETDPSGGLNYTITSTSQLLSVPYAMHAKTAGTIIDTIPETDPIYSSSVASGIGSTDTVHWNTAYNWGDHSAQGYLTQETQVLSISNDTVFLSGAGGSFVKLPFDGNWSSLLGPAPGVNIFPNNAGYLSSETDPLFSASVASGITASDTIYWNNKLDSYTETDPLFSAWDRTTGITITESQITDLNHFTTSDETDPIFSASVAAGINAGDTAFWNNKLDSFTETDPSVPQGVQAGEMQYYDGTEWVTLAPGNDGDILTMKNGVPTWNTDCSPVVITTKSVTNVTEVSAISGGEVIDDGGCSVTAYGVCWSTSQNPTINDSHTTDGSGTGSFTSNIMGLDSNTTYYVRAYAMNNADTAYGNQESFTTISGAGGSYPSGTVHCIPGGADVVDVTNPTTGETWMDRNLGASRQATSSNDSQAYGDLYQWGRFSDGHQCRNSGTTITLSFGDTPGHNKFIIGSNDWQYMQNDYLWQGVNGINNPCPSGYRLPTENELDSERLSWSSNNAAGAYGSPLKLPVAGYQHQDLLYTVGYYGYYWSSTVDFYYIFNLLFHSNFANIYSHYRADGNSVRCIKD